MSRPMTSRAAGSVVHTQSGYEKKVKQNLEARIGTFDMEEQILEVAIPMEDVIEFKAGRKVRRQEEGLSPATCSSVAAPATRRTT